MTTLSKLLHQSQGIDPELGELNGTCCLCGETTTKGHKKKFGSNNTAGAEVSTGDVICEYCIWLQKNSNELRRAMWLVTEKEFKKFKKQEAKEVILNLPDEPFVLYLTNTWQQIGWIKLSNRISLDKSMIVCATDYKIDFVDVEVIKDLFKFIETLRELKIPKKELESGTLSMHHLRKVDNPRMVLKRLSKYKNNPVWNLCVYLND
jgi:hypothetical protein